MKKSIFTIMLFAMAFLAKAQYPVVPIDTVQYINPTRLAAVTVGGGSNTLSDYISPTHHNARYKDTVVVEGIVTFDPAAYGLSTSRRSAFIQEASNRPWCGVEIMMDTAQITGKPTMAALDAASQFSQSLKKGRKVRVTCWIGNFQGHTQLYVLPLPIQVLSSGNTITPQEIKIEDVMKNVANTQTQQFTTGEKWEGVYVEIKNVFVNDAAPFSNNPQRWSWALNDGNGNIIGVRDYSGYYRNDNLDLDPNTPRNFTPPAPSTKLDYIRGVITESGSNPVQYFITPLYPDDIAVPLFNPPKVMNMRRNPAIVMPTTSPVIRANVQDDSAIASVQLYYAVGYNNTTFTAVTMSGTDSIYTATIPAQAAGSIVKYYIKAIDNGGHVINFPDSLALSNAYKVVTGITSIRDIQETPYSNGGSMFVNDTLRNITVSGIVVSTNGSNDLGLFALQNGTGPWSGIFVRPTIGDGVTNWKRGDSIVITEAIVTERFNAGTSDPFASSNTTFGVTFLERVKFTVAGRCKTQPVVTNLPFDSLISTTFKKEQYEAMMLSYPNIFVVDTNPDRQAGSNFGEWLVNTNQNATTGLRGENYSNDLGFTFNTDSILPKQALSVFQGLLSFAHGNWKMYPRNRTDVGKRGDLIAPYIVKIGADTIYHTKGQTYTDPGATACDDMDGNISSSVTISSSNVDVNTIGTYIVNFSVKDAAQNPALPVIRTVIVQDNIGVDELGKNITMGLYPVPVSNSLTLSLGTNYDGEGKVNILDIAGKVVATQSVTFTAGNTNVAISTTELYSGVYFCQFSSKYTSAVQKFVVVK